MKRIKKFGDFDDLDFISESRVYFMNDLLLKLRELRDEPSFLSEWASKLLKAQGNNIDTDTTFLDLNGENFSFSKEDDIKKVLFTQRMTSDEDINDFFGDGIRIRPSILNYLSPYDQNYIKKLPNRGQVKMGRVIRKLIPEIPDKDLENLVNILKSEQTGYEIKLVKGDDISEYYKSESCDTKLLGYGTLQSSCMMDKASKKPHIFDIYTKNPQVCQLAVMLNKDGELVGRALVWKIDEILNRLYTGNLLNAQKSELEEIKSELESNLSGFWKSLNLSWQIQPSNERYTSLKANTKNLFVMDRVYYTKDWISNAFIKWAKEKNFMIKVGSTFEYNGLFGDPIMSVKVDKLAYRQFPYMDTFKHYDVQSSILSNYDNSDRGFSLQNTTGEYYAKGTNTQKTIDKATNFIRRFKDYLK